MERQVPGQPVQGEENRSTVGMQNLMPSYFLSMLYIFSLPVAGSMLRLHVLHQILGRKNKNTENKRLKTFQLSSLWSSPRPLPGPSCIPWPDGVWEGKAVPLSVLKEGKAAVKAWHGGNSVPAVVLIPASVSAPSRLQRENRSNLLSEWFAVDEDKPIVIFENVSRSLGKLKIRVCFPK